VPPAAELKLLRAMQQEAIEMTRSADEGAQADRVQIAEDATRLQDGIATQARELLDRLAEQNREGGPPSRIEPAPVPPAEPTRPEEPKP